MNINLNPPLSEQIAAAMDWWRDAGVDSDFHDDPHCWLIDEEENKPTINAQPAASPRKEPTTPPTPAPLDRTTWPTSFADFNAWWLSEPMLDSGQTNGRISPRMVSGSGPQANADLMIIVPCPEKEDADSLLSGPQGRLLMGMVQAMALAPDAVYLISALPRYMPHADWAGLNQIGMGDVLRLHISLAAPKRLICFGGSILPLLGHDPANSSAFSRQFNHEAFTAPLFCARELALQLEKPRWKAGFWKNWLEWGTAG